MTYALWYSVVDLNPYLFGSCPKMPFVRRTERRALLYSAELLEDVEQFNNMLRLYNQEVTYEKRRQPGSPHPWCTAWVTIPALPA